MPARLVVVATPHGEERARRAGLGPLITQAMETGCAVGSEIAAMRRGPCIAAAVSRLPVTKKMERPGGRCHPRRWRRARWLTFQHATCMVFGVRAIVAFRESVC